MRTFYTLLLLAACLLGTKAWGQTRDTLVKFNGTGSTIIGGSGTGTSASAAGGTSANLGQTMTAFPARALTSGLQCNNTIYTDDWDTGANRKYWYIGVNTAKYASLELSFTQRSSNTGPRDFRVQYSTNGTIWTNANINNTVTNACTTVKNASLPAATEQIPTLQLRWIMTTDTSVTGGLTQDGGTNSLTDLVVTGVATNLLQPPALIAAPNASVDNPFALSFNDNAIWRDFITAVTINNVTLTSGYTISAGQITFNPALIPQLQTSGVKTIVVKATGYNNAVVNQTINSGVPTALAVTRQPAAPSYSGGTLVTQPIVNATDQYGNVSVNHVITATVTPGQGGSWTIGGTTGVATNTGGNANFTNLTATNRTPNPYSATITFTYGGVSVVSQSFIVPVPPPNDECTNAVTLIPSPSPTPVNGTFIAASPSSGAFTVSPTKNDVWYKFTTSCTSSYIIAMNFDPITVGMDPGWEAFATNGCPTSGSGDPFFLGTSTVGITSKARSAYLTAGVVYYIRVIDRGTVSVGNFNMTITINPPAQPGGISGNTTPCLGSTETYAVNPVIAGVNYTWTLPGGDWTGSLNASSITVSAGSSSGNITVTPSNGCGQLGPAQTLAVTPITEPQNITGWSVSPGNGKLTIAWDNPPNCFDEIMVVATDGSTVTLVPSGDGSQYLDTTEYASVGKNNGLNMNPSEYCMYKGGATAVIISGLLNANVYKIKIFTRWGTMWSPGVQVTGTPVAATTGAFKSVKTGTWTDHKTWNKWDGAAWIATSGPGDYPNYFASNVSIEPLHVVQLDLSRMAVGNLEVKSGARLWTNDSINYKYVTVYGGTLTCDGVIGNNNANLADGISFNIEGVNTTITGTGRFGCSRIRKFYTAKDPGGTNNTTLNILMNITFFFDGTVMFNDIDKFDLNSNFNVNLNAPYVLTLKKPTASVAIDGTNGKGIFSAGGTYTINGTLTIPGALYLSTNNELPAPKCVVDIGPTGKVYTSSIVASTSGTSQHTLSMKNGSLLQISDAQGLSIYSATNNPFNLATGSTVEYKANAKQLVLSGMNYQNLTLSGTDEKIISDAYKITTVNGALTINSNTMLSLGTGKTLFLNGTVTGPGTITGSATSGIQVGPGGMLTSTPLGVLKFTPGRDSLSTFTMDRMMRADVYPNHRYWAAVLGSNMQVKDSLVLSQGILATDKYLLTLLTYNSGLYAAYNKASYIATTDTLATAFAVGNTFNGSYGFRIKGVKANTDTYFPVGADFISPNRAMVNLGNNAPTRDLTVVLTKGDIGYTGAPRVNRIWYIHSSVNDSINASMRLYYTGYDLATYPYMTRQDELETGFTGTNVRLLEKAVLTDPYFTNISNGTDISFNGSPNTEVFAKYTRASTIYNGTKPGIFKFSIFSIVDSGNVVLPVVYTAVKAYQQGAGINIHWAVANETDISHYEVERAGDGRLFTAILSRQAQNSGTAGYKYTMTDIQPIAGANYYRIKAIGKDGQVLYSTVVNITLHTDGKGSLLIYPNPVRHQQCQVQLANLPAGTYNVVVYSMAGQVIVARQINYAGGTSSQTMYLPGSTAAGVYIVKLIGKEVQLQTSLFVSDK